MKTLFLLSLMLLSSPAFGQEPAVLEPIRIAITTEGEAPHDQALDKHVRAELNKLRDIVISSSPDVDFRILLTVNPISEEIACAGYVVTMLVINKQGQGYRHRQSNHTGADLLKLAGIVTAKLNKDFFQTRRRAPYNTEDQR